MSEGFLYRLSIVPVSIALRVSSSRTPGSPTAPLGNPQTPGSLPEPLRPPSRKPLGLPWSWVLISLLDHLRTAETSIGSTGGLIGSIGAYWGGYRDFKVPIVAFMAAYRRVCSECRSSEGV